VTPLTPSLPGYRDVELIAHGTTSLVFRAVQERLDRTVAIKLLLVDQADTTREAASRELATMVRLSAQPHIVGVIDTGTTADGRPYTVMEFCEGGSYAQILAGRGPLPVDEVVEVGTAIGEALHAAHQAGVIHRDVKPSNILRSRFGPALADFGIARAPDELSGTLTREMMTPHHASPEALLHQAQSAPSDVYSLASTMWTLLTGHPPFAGPSRPALDLLAFRDRVLNEQLPVMPRKDVPAWLVAEVSRAMSKLPAQRHGSAREFADALRRGALGLGQPTTQAVPRDLPTTPTAAAPAPLIAGPIVHEPGLPPAAWPVWGPPPGAAMPPPATTPASHSTPSPAAPSPSSPPPPPPPVPVTSLAEDPDGGWAGALPMVAPAPPPPRPAPAERPRADFRPPPPPPPRRRGAVVGVLLGIAVLAVIAGAVALAWGGLGRGAGPDPAAAATAVSSAPAPSGTRFVSPAASGAPLNVTLTDNRTSVTLTWTDPTGTGTVPIAISVRTSDNEYLDLVTPALGRTSAKVSRLDPKVNYCFYLTAIYSSEQLAPAAPVCTHR
jgi:serine/threonine-protein kinase PknK